MAASAGDTAALKQELLVGARDNSARQYDDLLSTFRALDTKAQTTAAIAGVQLAGLLAFLRFEDLRVLLDTFGRVPSFILLSTILVLVIVIGASMAAMRVRSVPLPYQATEEIEAVLNLVRLEKDEFSEEVVLNHLREHLLVWKETIEGMAIATDRKASYVVACQWGMLAGLGGAGSVFCLLVTAIWGR